MASVTLTDFARRRLFPQPLRNTSVQDLRPEEFEAMLNEQEPERVIPGYAPFCQLWVYPNHTQTRCSVIPITAHNQHALRSAYEARSPRELPVLVRWFEGQEAPRARYLLPILYSQEQLAKEGSPIDAQWGVVGCLYTLEPAEIPMAPITMLRNALGVEEGGSGVQLDREAYATSVEFWQQHANWR